MNEDVKLDTVKDRLNFVIKKISPLFMGLLGGIALIISVIQAMVVLILEGLFYIPFCIIWVLFNVNFKGSLIKLVDGRTLFDLWLNYERKKI